MSTTSTKGDSWSATTYERNASFVYSAAYTAPVLELLRAQPGEHVLDLGCGNGPLTVSIADMVGPQGSVYGVDSSESMIAQANKLFPEHAVASFGVVDVSALTPKTASELRRERRAEGGDSKWDVVFSNAALHWILAQAPEPINVLKGIHNVLKPDGGRFVGEMGGFMNCVGVRSAIWRVLTERGYDARKIDPWFFPSTEQFSKLLTEAGFQVRHISLVPRITPLPGSLGDWLETFWKSVFLGHFSNADKETQAQKQVEVQEIMRRVEEACEVDCRDANGQWSIMYVRLRFETAVAS